MIIVIWHGEHRSLYYLVDATAPEDEQPCVVATYHNLDDALQALERPN